MGLDTIPFAAPGTACLTAGVGLLAALVSGRWGTVPARRREPVRPPDHDHLALVDLGRLTSIRQSVGDEEADRVVAEAAERVRGLLPGAAIGRVGRSSLDFTFAAADRAGAAALLAGVADGLAAPYPFGELAFELDVAIGFVELAALAGREALLEAAIAALPRARATAGRVVYAGTQGRASTGDDDRALMRALPEAMRSGELDLHYQPKLNARTNRISAVEALLRWRRPSGDMVPPGRLVPMVEDAGAIRGLTEWVLVRALRDRRTMLAAGHDLEIAVNISGLLLPDRAFRDRALAVIGAEAPHITLEITETAIIADPVAAIDNLRAFRAAGVKVAIDDFGSGLSSLAYLKQLPAHELKIDKLFVSDLTECHRNPLLVRASIDLAHALEMEVTAEGVEEPMAFTLLQLMGCDLLQGYLISRPLPLPALLQFLAEPGRIEQLSDPARMVAARAGGRQG